MNVLQLSRALIAIVLAALCLGAGYGVSRLVETKPQAVAPPDTTKLIAEGYAFFDSGEFDKAADRFGSATVVFPENGEAWFMLGMFRHYEKDFDGARDCFEKAIEFNYRPGLAHFNMGCGYSLQNKKAEAIYELELAVKSGLMARSYFSTDPDLQNLRDEPEFKEMLKDLQHPLARFPLAVAMERRIGSWDVFTQKNQFRGTLKSNMTLNGYGIEEHLVNAVGLAEQALYLYNTKDNTWSCTFADGKGAIGNLKGTIKNGKLQVSGPMTGSQSGLRRITIEFTPEGIIHETHETATGEGKPFTILDVYTLKPYQG